MASRDPREYIGSKARALQIPDMKVAMETLKLLGVDPKGKGIRTKDDAIKIIIEQLDRGANASVPVKQAPSRGLRKAIEDDQVSRKKLHSKYESLHNFYKELPANYQKDLAHVFPNIEAEFEQRKNEIKKSECTILVAGETAAGKSSLINLLLGGLDILPTSTLGCTSTICELRTSRDGRKEAIGYCRSIDDGRSTKGRKQQPVIFDLSTDGGIKRFQEAVKDSDGDEESPFDKIEINMPFPMLEEGIVIVDTPGIGGSGNMAKYAERYLSKSYGFIYVVNSANAGGVQKGRLQNFMRLVINSAGEEGFNSDATMFVCNRWDMIPERDREAVKEDTMEKLSRYYKDIRRSQVHFMSIAEASKALQYQTTTPEYMQLMDIVEKLMPDTLRSRLNAHYRWMSAVLKRSIYSLKVSKVIEAKSMERVKEEFEQVKKQIHKMEQNSKDSISYLKANITMESEGVVSKILGALQSRAVADRLFDWRPQDLPGDDRKRLIGDAVEAIANRVTKEMNIWERENGIVQGIKEKIIRVCKRDFELMEGQIARLEGALVGGDSSIVKDIHKSIKKQTPVKQLWNKAKNGGMDDERGNYKGLGGTIATVASIKTTDKTLKKIFSEYKLKDTGKCIQKMESATRYFLDCIMESRELQDKIQIFFKRFLKGIDAVAKMIPDFLKADLQLMDDLRKQMGDTESNLRELYPKLICNSHSLLGQIDLFFVNYVMVFDYNVNEIAWDQHDAPVGSGSFADVFIGKVQASRIAVALKVCRDPLKEHTVSDILLEDRTLRELDHKHIVRYYGATYRFRNKTQMRDMQWIMLMEVCPQTLKSKFLNSDVQTPGRLPQGSDNQLKAMIMMANYALQLCQGLQYLHEKGFVHRDLKLENVLMTEDNIVKLTDVGLTKSRDSIAFSKVGSPVYMAPEVLLQTQNYDDKADIYSLGIILWEMWYGKDAADYISQQLFGPLESAIKEGLRPSLKLNVKPPEPWKELIEASMQEAPEKRPPVEVFCKFFNRFIVDARRM